ncbi:MAG: hypothetical protein ABJD73_10205 [Lentilitoribacter sp.]
MDIGVLFWLELATRLAQLIASAGVVFVSFSVFRWTKRRDAADFFRSNWADQQNTNLMHLGNPVARSVHEKMVYGYPIDDEEREVLFFVLFTKINRVLQFYNAMKSGLISKEEYVSQTKGTMKLLGNQEYWVRYLVAERGYSNEFRNEMLGRLQSTGSSKHWDDYSIQELEEKLQNFRKDRTKHQ